MVLSREATQAPVLHTSIEHVAKPSAAHAHTHTQYLIRVADARSPGLHWTVYRRYSEFRALKLRLEAAAKRGDLCGSCAIMAKRTCFMMFPPRRLFGNLKESTLERRRVGLNVFIEAVSAHARACGARGTCHTRPLMDQFLMVNDMRYTYLNVNMGDSSEDEPARSKAAASPSIARGHGRRAMTPNSLRATSLASRLNRLSYSGCARDEHSLSMHDQPNNSDVMDEIAQRRCAWSSSFEARDKADTGSGPEEDPAEQQLEPSPSMGDSPAEFEGRLFKAPRDTGAPQLLRYAKERRSRTSSWNDESASGAGPSALRPHSISDWSAAKQQMAEQGTPRHSDPGLSARSELLNMPRGSFSGGTRRAENGRARNRKVHLSSAAKRIKRLEEQEARFGSEPRRRRQRVPMLPTISEE